MADALITVVETPGFAALAKKLLSDVERQSIAVELAADPTCGDLVVGGSGIRKVRAALQGSGKSGGVRVMYYYHNPSFPIFLLTLFAKNEKDNLSDSEKAVLAKVGKAIAERYGE